MAYHRALTPAKLATLILFCVVFPLTHPINYSLVILLFAPLKAAYRNQVDGLERGGIGIICKQHFTYLCSSARERAFTKRNILAGWKASGLYPFNSDKVLTETPKPVIQLTVPALKTCEIGLCPQGEVLQTPVTSEALILLHNLIK